jgi:hypothetical protein
LGKGKAAGALIRRWLVAANEFGEATWCNVAFSFLRCAEMVYSGYLRNRIDILKTNSIGGNSVTTAWFVDGGYALSTWNSVSGGARMDYNRLRSKIEDDAGEKIGDAYYFNCDSDPPKIAQNGFHNFLRSPPPRGPGMRVKLYWLQTTSHEWPRHMGGGPIVHPVSGEQYITKTQKAVDADWRFI